MDPVELSGREHPHHIPGRNCGTSEFRIAAASAEYSAGMPCCRMEAIICLGFNRPFSGYSFNWSLRVMYTPSANPSASVSSR